MARREYDTIEFEDVKERIEYIKDSNDYYISENGNVYSKINEGFYKMSLNVNKNNGYVYCTITMKDMKKKSFRVHRLVAMAFVFNNNEENTIVMHLDNNKTNNHYSNLKWGTISENTKQAFDDGLEVNKKGYEDDQSNPIYVYDLMGNLLYDFGSISMASKELGISKSTISRQCKGVSKGKPRCGYVFKFQ